MRLPTSETINKRLAESPRLAQRDRIKALKAIGRPPLLLLRRLLTDPAAPPRLLAVAREQYEIAMLRKDLRKRARQNQTT